MKRDLSFTKRFYIQNTLAWLIINGYGTKQDVFKAIDLYYDSYRDFNRFNHDLMISEVNAVQYMNQQEKLWNLMFVDIVSNSHYVSAKQKSDLFAILFPNNPHALTQFNKQISELKRTKLRNVKIKHSEYFPHYYYDPDLTCRDFCVNLMQMRMISSNIMIVYKMMKGKENLLKLFIKLKVNMQNKHISI
jgi:hypothetical protein